jgi:hypothetical protein
VSSWTLDSRKVCTTAHLVPRGHCLVILLLRDFPRTATMPLLIPFFSLVFLPTTRHECASSRPASSTHRSPTEFQKSISTHTTINLLKLFQPIFLLSPFHPAANGVVTVCSYFLLLCLNGATLFQHQHGHPTHHVHKAVFCQDQEQRPM